MPSGNSARFRSNYRPASAHSGGQAQITRSEPSMDALLPLNLLVLWGNFKFLMHTFSKGLRIGVLREGDERLNVPLVFFLCPNVFP